MRLRHASAVALAAMAASGAPSTAYLVAWVRGGQVFDMAVYSEETPTNMLPGAEAMRAVVVSKVTRATYAEASMVLLLRAASTDAKKFRGIQLQLAQVSKQGRRRS